MHRKVDSHRPLKRLWDALLKDKSLESTAMDCTMHISLKYQTATVKKSASCSNNSSSTNLGQYGTTLSI